ncbi:MAG: hypothetical protein FWD17_05410, partial [Polyangiaceae bacterium]|nr:hypothetical protein [Polyangiaceae bacterium]
MNHSSHGLVYRLLSCFLAALLIAQPFEGVARAHAAAASRITQRLRSIAPPATAAPAAAASAPAPAPRAGVTASPTASAPASSPLPGADLVAPVAASGGPLDVLPVPVPPRSVEWLTAPAAGGADPWALFDGRGDPAFGAESSDPVRLAIDLASPTRLAALTVLGPTEGTLTVWAAEGDARRPIEPLDRVEVRARRGEWKRLPVHDAGPVSRLIVEWAASSPTGPSGLGLWGLSAPVREATDPELADRILSGALPGTLVAKGAPDAAEISRIGFGPGAASMPRDGRFEVRLDTEPHTWAHAFLVYELTGIGHFTQAVRQINGGTPRGGAGVTVTSEGGLQVEEIAPEWLRRGENEIRFLPLPQVGAPSYSVRNVRIVGTGHAGLVETRMSGASSKGGQLHRALAFETMSQPHDLVFELLEPTQGLLSLHAAGAPKTAGAMQVDLKGMEPGWHHVALDGLPASSAVDVALEPRHGGAAFARPVEGVSPPVSEVALTASALPRDRERIAVAYPLHGECRDHHVRVTGFVGGADDRVVGLRANGVEGDVGADGSFAVDVPEGTGSGEWSAALEATLASGKVLRRALPLSPCEETPATANPDTSEDDGAPFVALVRAGEKKTIAFAGATLDIPAGAVDHDVRITVRPLMPGQLAKMSPGLVNVSPEHRAYRF